MHNLALSPVSSYHSSTFWMAGMGRPSEALSVTSQVAFPPLQEHVGPNRNNPGNLLFAVGEGGKALGGKKKFIQIFMGTFLSQT